MIDCGSAACYTGSNKRTGVDSDMDTLMEFSIQGDIFFFYDTLSDEEKETVRKCMREKYKGHIVANPKIDEFLEGLERDADRVGVLDCDLLNDLPDELIVELRVALAAFDQAVPHLLALGNLFFQTDFFLLGF